MKSRYSILILTSLLMVTSCKKELYKDPIGLLTPDQINLDPNLNTVRSSVTSSYQMLASTLNLIGDWGWDDGVVTRNDFILGDIASDDAQKKWNPDGDQAWMDEIDNFNFTANNGGFNGIWSYDYEGVARTNLSLNYLTDEAILTKIGIEETLKNRLLGESYFLRAFYYFDLVVNFGDVPLLLKPLENFSEAYDVAKRIPAADVWEQIRADLAQAKILLPDSKFADASEPWRASKGAVIALQAKVALYNEAWQEVIDRVNELQGLQFYSLNNNYFDSFNVSKEFTDNEVIFAYNHESGKNPPNGNGLCALLDWGFLAPTTDFVNTFEANDPRLSYTVDVSKQAIFKVLGATNTSYKGNEDAPSNRIYIRWADVLLWKAEAANEVGNYSDAVTIINQIRTRARTTPNIDGSTPPAGTLPPRNVQATDKNQIKEWLMHERRVELGFESQRFNDLKRWKIAKEVLTAQGKNFKDNNYLYPIPQGEIDKSGGTITQNPSY